ncbi:Cytochrome c oxidase assembly factor 3, mitochondrial [Fulvia fulva]|uniref:Cytochrome c oxidase assembly factor 3 n=1 Tax=Passalora fulva TaxID=5499 RepID=A0A9Q8P4F2_PASFU|nr:Cytochrome c oxidase assembly factor 3, mitochondrial [Fulvia fulva]KAK4636343.1 Cytochrome c oxidase assembly factor 3, mitochondrial [Fulvia fulva]KAK4638420.1 Cytochrome c oxidase assembly factor 3, mitochondrial [Fulvia fulva]UJO12751.1 Cytochrome c oxidase assembly factor 3, mitochondrial [Fulvia fulva]WPV09844.1 Cytochrome c oxidase assembly factor 3, mitochondrial [Fulvia fulva]WPV23284.1 Cytochrome c oxidase assembly factor 3, mitochondrial [Fulvia fulva]
MPLGRIPQSSYYDKYNRPSAALYRARQPYLVRNALTGVAIFGFVAAVYTWTIKAIGQDDFSDVPIPDAPAQPAHAPNMSTVKSAGSKQ